MCHSRRYPDLYIANRPHPPLLNLEEQVVENHVANENPIKQVFFGFLNHFLTFCLTFNLEKMVLTISLCTLMFFKISVGAKI